MTYLEKFLNFAFRNLNLLRTRIILLIEKKQAPLPNLANMSVIFASCSIDLSLGRKRL